MPLPDISRFASLEAEEWRALGLRLAQIGLTSEYLRPITQLGGNLTSELRLAVQRWHLRRLEDPSAWGARLLMFEDTVREPEACCALGETLIGQLVEAGMIMRRHDGAFTCPFHLCIADRIYVFCDDLTHGGDAVMGAGETTLDLCRAAYPAETVGRALEIGCGAGTIALVLAQRAERVVATDTNPRALALARVNAAINGTGNVEFRAGGAFHPVAGERFDLIVSQPPYVSRPPGAHEAAYLYGGDRGDELPMRLLENVCAHLAPRGRAVLLIQWPDAGGPPPEERIPNAAACDDARVVVLRYPPPDLDYHCAMYASSEVRPGSHSLDERFSLWRGHLESLGIQRLQSTLMTIQRDPEVPAWTAALDLPQESTDQVTSASIDQLIANYNLANTDSGSLLRSTLRPPAGTILTKEYTLDDASKPAIRAHLPEASYSRSVELSEGSLLLISLVAAAETVGDAVEEFAARQGVTPAQALQNMEPAIRQSLKLGVLSTASPNCL
ncbi:MAG TPA: class I SAM-dependent methyltransferase [Bryobacteraceae bacterium]|nr:class I SAM-dependent methyltransferase [Bryobacteraceae bacterium]